MVVHESTDKGQTSSDNALRMEKRMVNMPNLRKIMNSKTRVDRQLIDAYMVRESVRRGQRVISRNKGYDEKAGKVHQLI